MTDVLENIWGNRLLNLNEHSVTAAAFFTKKLCNSKVCMRIYHDNIRPTSLLLYFLVDGIILKSHLSHELEHHNDVWCNAHDLWRWSWACPGLFLFAQFFVTFMELCLMFILGRSMNVISSAQQCRVVIFLSFWNILERICCMHCEQVCYSSYQKKVWT